MRPWAYLICWCWTTFVPSPQSMVSSSSHLYFYYYQHPVVASSGYPADHTWTLLSLYFPWNEPSHTVAIWIFTFHEKPGCVQLIWKANFKPILQAKLLNFLVWKFRSITPNFLLFFAEFVKSSAFYSMLLLLFQRVDILELWFLHQITIQILACSRHWSLQKFEFQLSKFFFLFF